MEEERRSGEDGATLAELAQVVRRLAERVEELERRLAPARSEGPPPPRGAEPPPLPPAAPAGRPVAPGARALPTPVPGASRTLPPRAPRAPARAPWAIGPLRDVPRENLPVVLLGGLGGLALLLGALYFAWYSVRRGWLSPEVRVSLTAAFGLVAMGSAWRLAPRGHASLASGLGGAGLGAWFAGVLVARHVHELLGPASTFALLVLGAALGLAIATHRGLRVFATLATLGALLTPPAIGTSSEEPHELFAYQSVLVLFLHAIEDRRRWPELGLLAVLGSWGLALGWAAEHAGTPRPAVWAWAFAYVALLSGSTLLHLRRGRISPLAAAPRFLVTALAAWLVAVVGANGQGEDLVTLGLALANGIAAGLLVRLLAARPAAPGARHRQDRAAALGALASPAWLQLHAFGALRWGPQGETAWWTALALAAAALVVARPGLAATLAFLLPWTSAVVEASEHHGRVFATLGFVAAALPLAIGLLPDRAAVARRARAFDLSLAFELVLGGLGLALVAGTHTRGLVPHEGWHLAVCVGAAVPVVLRLAAEPTRARSEAWLVLLAGLLLLALGLSQEAGLFELAPGLRRARAWQVGGLLVVAALGTLHLRQLARLDPPPGDARWPGRAVDVDGLLVAAALVLAAMLAAASAVGVGARAPVDPRSLLQALWSVAWAAGALGLLVRGLYGRRATWRRAGLLALLLTGLKVLFVDLVAVSMLWRVVSFAGLGTCLLLGAYAYRRLGLRLAAEDAGREEGPSS